MLHIKIIHLFDEMRTNVKSMTGDMKNFSMKIIFYQVSAFSKIWSEFVFVGSGCNELAKSVQNEAH